MLCAKNGSTGLKHLPEQSLKVIRGSIYVLGHVRQNNATPAFQSFDISSKLLQASWMRLGDEHMHTVELLRNQIQRLTCKFFQAVFEIWYSFSWLPPLTLGIPSLPAMFLALPQRDVISDGERMFLLEFSCHCQNCIKLLTPLMSWDPWQTHWHRSKIRLPGAKRSRKKSRLSNSYIIYRTLQNHCSSKPVQ